MKGGTEPSDKRTLNGKVGMQGSLGAIAKDRNGNVNGIWEETPEGSKSADFKNGQIQERVAAHTKSRPSKETTVAGRFLSEYNRHNNTKYAISQEQPGQDDITDVLVVDELTGRRMNLQVTVSDESPWILLARGGFVRSGHAQKIHTEAIMRAIAKKREKYGKSCQGVILLLDGWFSVTGQMLAKIRQTNGHLLSNAGFDEIWFVGKDRETIVQLV